MVSIGSLSGYPGCLLLLSAVLCSCHKSGRKKENTGLVVHGKGRGGRRQTNQTMSPAKAEDVGETLEVAVPRTWLYFTLSLYNPVLVDKALYVVMSDPEYLSCFVTPIPCYTSGTQVQRKNKGGGGRSAYNHSEIHIKLFYSAPGTLR